MSSSFKLDGLNELRAALRELPQDLTSEASVIVLSNAREAQRGTQDGYPEGPTGNLIRGVTMEADHSGRLGVVATVRSRARHSHIFERGSVVRRTRTGANRGAMPEAPEAQRMIPRVMRRRRIMVEALKALVRKAGFVVE